VETEFKEGDRVKVIQFGGDSHGDYPGRVGTVVTPLSNIGYVEVRLDEDPWGENASPLLCLLEELEHTEEEATN
jgi:membrane protein implicated in regulation of membrane protease activity